MSTTLAGPPSACCWTGFKHTGSPEGRIEPLGGLDTYIAEPPAGTTSGPHRKVLLFLADIRGPLFINSKLLQDYFASCGTFSSIVVTGTSGGTDAECTRIHRAWTRLLPWRARPELASRQRQGCVDSRGPQESARGLSQVDRGRQRNVR